LSTSKNPFGGEKDLGPKPVQKETLRLGSVGEKKRGARASKQKSKRLKEEGGRVVRFLEKGGHTGRSVIKTQLKGTKEL